MESYRCVPNQFPSVLIGRREDQAGRATALQHPRSPAFFTVLGTCVEFDILGWGGGGPCQLTPQARGA